MPGSFKANASSSTRRPPRRPWYRHLLYAGYYTGTAWTAGCEAIEDRRIEVENGRCVAAALIREAACLTACPKN
jgi:hypothetical protein